MEPPFLVFRDKLSDGTQVVTTVPLPELLVMIRAAHMLMQRAVAGDAQSKAQADQIARLANELGPEERGRKVISWFLLQEAKQIAEQQAAMQVQQQAVYTQQAQVQGQQAQVGAQPEFRPVQKTTPGEPMSRPTRAEVERFEAQRAAARGEKKTVTAAVSGVGPAGIVQVKEGEAA